MDTFYFKPKATFPEAKEFYLRFINDDDDLSVKEFVSLADLKEYINQKNLEKTWHQIEEVKKVIPNLKED